ncbi:MAG: dipeptide epimerase [Candidatus Heimdallarchaeota archaeon]|nr:dipeptide epimerase [Candidatus Heimdallarchaeota archaeon]
MSKIASIEIYKMDLDFSYVITISLGTIEEAENILVKVTTDTGIVGWGEGSPYPMITGETQGSAITAAKYLGHKLVGRDATAIEENSKRMKLILPSHPSVRSAFDMAMWDILGKESNLPVYKILGGKNRQLRTDMTIGHENSLQDVQNQAQKYLDQGCNEIKMKTGRSGNTDYLHVKAVRELAGEDVSLKIDSNQGWDYPQALRNARLMEPLNLLYFEQPLPLWNLDDMARLRNKINIPVCADESVFDEIDAFKICKLGAADYLNIKLGKSGGIQTGLMINAISESYGAKCMIGCFDETRLGLTAAAHLVLARPNITFLDLDSALFLKDDPIIGGMEYGKENKSILTVGEKPGLGVDLKDEYLSKWKKWEIK